MKRHIIRPLDRYVFSEFWRIFVPTELGFPVVVVILDLADHLDSYLGRNLPRSQIALSYLYWLPDTMFLVLPAAVLFATVFAIGSLTRHSEITAAKASGISFYRFIAPIFVGALFATLLGLVLGEIAPTTNRRRMELLETKKYTSAGDRYNFAYSAEAGRTYNIASLHQQLATLEGVEIQRKGGGPDYPSYIVSATGAKYRQKSGWLLSKGSMHILPNNTSNLTFSFDSLIDRHFTERPENLAVSPKAPSEMEFRELGRFIKAMERSGTDVNVLRVERMLKIAIPVTSMVILLFGAPLATSTKRGGAAYGVGISLATTVIFLMLIQLTKAIGGHGLLTPELAAWLPSLIFGTIGAVLFIRIRT